MIQMRRHLRTSAFHSRWRGYPPTAFVYRLAQVCVAGSTGNSAVAAITTLSLRVIGYRTSADAHRRSFFVVYALSNDIEDVIPHS